MAPKPYSYSKDEILAMYKQGNIELLGRLPQVARDEPLVKCLVCKYEWKQKFSNLLLEYGCAKCSGNLPIAKWSTDENIAAYDKINVELIDSLPQKVKERRKVKCRVCKRVWRPSFVSVRAGNGCSKCSGMLPLSEWPTDKIMAVYEKANVILIDSLPQKAKDKPKARCRKCNHEWSPVFYHLQDNHGCPKCKASRGEKYINEVLRTMRLDFEREKKFSTCQNKRLLPFDFFLPCFNLLIEYQGELHHFAVDHFGGQEALEYTKKRDKIKADWADQSSYELLCINYWDYDRIAEILADRLPYK